MTRLTATPVLAALVFAAAGCGGGTADVSGKVTYQGKPVVFGTVVLIGPDGVPKSGPIQPDGSFRVTGVKPGAAKVAVSSPPPPGATLPKKGPAIGRDAGDKPPENETPVSPEVARNWFPLPDKFADPAQSGATADVQSGKPVDIDLK